jgi:8-oxo-dGTP diphosphatase
MSRHTLVPASYILIINDNNETLFGQRQNTGWMDGQLMGPAGHIEQGEFASTGLIRELEEEIGVIIAPEDLEFAGILHRIASDDERSEFFFFCRKWTGEIQNLEPNKCKALTWHSINNLPDNTVDYLKVAIPRFFAGQKLVELDTRAW